jgi:hypothetical protein
VLRARPSIHVKVSLEDALLEWVWLAGHLTLWANRCRLSRWVWHLRDRLGSFVNWSGGARRRSGRGEDRAGGSGQALSSRSELLAPVETLIICAWGDWPARKPRGRGRAEAHAALVRSGRSGASGAVVLVNGILVNSLAGIGRETGAAEEGGSACWACARQTNSGQRKTPSLVVNGRSGNRARKGRGACSGEGAAALEESAEGGLGDGTTASRHFWGRAVSFLGRHIEQENRGEKTKQLVLNSEARRTVGKLMGLNAKVREDAKYAMVQEWFDFE